LPPTIAFVFKPHTDRVAGLAFPSSPLGLSEARPVRSRSESRDTAEVAKDLREDFRFGGGAVRTLAIAAALHPCGLKRGPRRCERDL
jgi:hypothetical protein